MPILSNVLSSASKLAANAGKALNLKDYNVSEFLLKKAYAASPAKVTSGVSGGGSGGGGGSSWGDNTTTTKNSTGGSSSSSGYMSTQDEEESLKSDADRLQKEIENEYENTIGNLNLQENELTSQLPITEQEITNSYNEMLPSINSAQGTAVSDLESQEQTGRAETKGVMGNARQIYNELISGASKFGGSAGQAFGELLGRSTAQTMGEARNNLTTLVTKVRGEIARANQFYNDKKASIQQQMNTAIENARQEFRSEIAKIRELKNVALRDKSLGNMTALSNFQNNVAQIRKAAAIANQEIDKWKSGKEKTAQEIAAAAWETYNLAATSLSKIGKGVANPEQLYSNIYSGEENQLEGVTTYDEPKYDSATGQWIYPGGNATGSTTQEEKNWWEN